jgi:hypothetical protein
MNPTTISVYYLRTELRRIMRVSFISQILTLTYLLTYSMEQSPSWEANWSAASQEIPHILRNPKAHHRTHKRTPPVPILSYLHPVHTPTSHFPKIHPNIILPSTTDSPQWSPSLRFSHQNPVHTSPLTLYALHATPISFFLILSPAKYWVRSTDYSALHYVIFSIPLSPRPS